MWSLWLFYCIKKAPPAIRLAFRSISSSVSHDEVHFYGWFRTLHVEASCCSVTMPSITLSDWKTQVRKKEREYCNLHDGDLCMYILKKSCGFYSRSFVTSTRRAWVSGTFMCHLKRLPDNGAFIIHLCSKKTVGHHRCIKCQVNYFT